MPVQLQVNQADKVICHLPEGQYKGKEGKTPVAIPAQKGGTCWYYSMLRIINLGKFGKTTKAHNDLVISELRKRISGIDTFYNFLMFLKKRPEVLKRLTMASLQDTDTNLITSLKILYMQFAPEGEGLKTFEKVCKTKSDEELKSYIANACGSGDDTTKLASEKQKLRAEANIIALKKLQDPLEKDFEDLEYRFTALKLQQAELISFCDFLQHIAKLPQIPKTLLFAKVTRTDDIKKFYKNLKSEVDPKNLIDNKSFEAMLSKTNELYLKSILACAYQGKTDDIEQEQKKAQNNIAQTAVNLIKSHKHQAKNYPDFTALISELENEISQDKSTTIGNILARVYKEFLPHSLFEMNQQKFIEIIKDNFEQGEFKLILGACQPVIYKTMVEGNNLKYVDFKSPCELAQILRENGPVTVAGHIGATIYKSDAKSKVMPAKDAQTPYPVLYYTAQDKETDYAQGVGHQVVIIGILLDSETPNDVKKAKVLYLDPNNADKPGQSRDVYMTKFETIYQDLDSFKTCLSRTLGLGIVSTKHNAPEVQTSSAAASSPSTS